MGCRRTANDGLTDEGPSPALRCISLILFSFSQSILMLRVAQSPSLARLAHRMSYFRYFGPTAIVPGYKQMVGGIKEHRPRHPSHWISANSSGVSLSSTCGSPANPNSMPTIPAGATIDSLEDIPFYDPTGTAPNNPLIVNIVETFFLNLGCHFPFL